MGAGQAISIDLPGALYERLQRLAEQHDRSVEDVLVETLEVLFGTEAQEPTLAALDGYSDDQLWAVVYRRLAWTERERLRELNARAERGTLTNEERAERAELLDQVDRYTLLRTRALHLLKKRGVDVAQLLKLGT